ncbi:MAG: hypothetical protein H6887_09380 [Hoeflea sp.]|nr:hypothetical protein [Hoeflea sp.]
MTNKVAPTIWSILIFVAGGLAGYLANWLIDYTLIRGAFCQADELNCARQWIGALSGWVAAAAAGVTVVILWRQLRLMTEENAFFKGEAAPEMSIEPNKVSDVSFSTGLVRAATLHITNYNRRRIQVEMLTVKGLHNEHWECGGVTIDGVAQDDLPPQPTKFGSVPGWTDRNAAQPRMAIEIELWPDGEDGSDISGEVEFHIRARTIGSHNKTYRLTERANLVTVGNQQNADAP